MNKVLVLSTVISATLTILTACNKEKASQLGKPDELNGTLTESEVLHVSDTVIKRGQTVTAGLPDTTWRGDWKVEPSEGTKILANNNTAEILFTQPGMYSITATENGSGTVHLGLVVVTDHPYTQPVFSPPSGLAADEIITLEPLAYKDDVLVFYARAKNSYSCWPLLVHQNNTTATTVSIDFLGTPNTAAINCTPGPYPAPHCFVYTRGYANGTHPVSIRLGQPLTTYTGTVTITDDKYTFSWPDNIPVVIAPKQINRVK